MANICLPKPNRDKLKNALKNKDISLEKLYGMSSEERQIIFKQYVGKDFASFVNGKFEQAMVSNQNKALADWIKNTTSFKDPIRRDMLKKVERNKKFLAPDEEAGFLQDLAEQKLGIRVTEEEAETVLKMKKEIDDGASKWNATQAESDIANNARDKNAGWSSEEDRLTYGYSLDNFKQYVGGLKNEADALTLRERFSLANTRRNILDVANTTKSMVATLDNSFIGRQGIKVMLTNPKMWAKTAAKSFQDFGEELVAKSGGLFKERDDAVMAAIRADVFSRPNAMNGKYRAAKNGYGLGLLHEEAFPSSIPERIPLLGRIFKASETAFNGSAMRMRADLADATIANAEKNGVDMLDEAQATAHGEIVAAMTGRGEIGRLASVGEDINALFFSIRFLKSNFDTLTAHQFNKNVTPEAKALARKNIVRIVATLGSVLSISKAINPDSTDLDPRSDKFGKICVSNHCYDITGGMSGLVRLPLKTFLPTYHDGQWGLWSYSSRTRTWKNAADAQYGENNALDNFEAFWEGKLSPSAGAVRDWMKGYNFDGEKPTVVNTTIGLITPISFDILHEELKKGNSDLIGAMFMETVGLSSSSRDIGGFGEKWQQLKEERGDEVFNKATKTVTEKFNSRADTYEKSSRYKNDSDEERTDRFNQIRREETERVFKSYGLK